MRSRTKGSGQLWALSPGDVAGAWAAEKQIAAGLYVSLLARVQHMVPTAADVMAYMDTGVAGDMEAAASSFGAMEEGVVVLRERFALPKRSSK
ncbi:hypothetical protein B0H65DRAFT_545505 [Neurospora tetraspora]|uniref:Uncharacterized protein n=1 Tax=Neurospora tetraspora TaxID=94610 RepID=A0AAE0MTX5_9PEZI|nr:hypothetical protein B0H65DRAFT_545505 [Neurospora tetraspora]